MKLLTACWCAAAARYAPMVLALTVIDFVADGFTWDSVRRRRLSCLRCSRSCRSGRRPSR